MYSPISRSADYIFILFYKSRMLAYYKHKPVSRIETFQRYVSPFRHKVGNKSLRGQTNIIININRLPTVLSFVFIIRNLFSAYPQDRGKYVCI